MRTPTPDTDTTPDTPRDGRGWLRALRDCSGTAADRRNQILIVVALLAWALAHAGARGALAAGASAGWLLPPMLLAAVTLVVYARFLRQTDEYVRALQMQGLALGFGLGLFVLTGVELLAVAGPAWAFAGQPVTVLLVCWALAQLFVAWRHR